MNRTIKFRAWTGSKMEYNIMSGFLGAFYVKGIDENDAACMSPFNTIYESETPVMQFTGLHDKNGVEIYEGDIIRCHQADVNEVHWFWDAWAYRNFHAEALPLGDLGNPYMNDGLLGCEVIGNIHMNPELL